MLPYQIVAICCIGRIVLAPLTLTVTITWYYGTVCKATCALTSNASNHTHYVHVRFRIGFTHRHRMHSGD
jgi:hypothetical protein